MTTRRTKLYWGNFKKTLAAAWLRPVSRVDWMWETMDYSALEKGSCSVKCGKRTMRGRRKCTADDCDQLLNKVLICEMLPCSLCFSFFFVLETQAKMFARIFFARRTPSVMKSQELSNANTCQSLLETDCIFKTNNVIFQSYNGIIIFNWYLLKH